jgi:hypothetical protein
MPTYDVLVSDELLPEFNNDNPRLPNGFRIVGPADGPAGYRSVRMRVDDVNAPQWTEGRLVAPMFIANYDDDGNPLKNTISGYALESEEAAAASAVVQRAEDNPGRTFTVGRCGVTRDPVDGRFVEEDLVPADELDLPPSAGWPATPTEAVEGPAWSAE